jgi:hypothetical protein
MKLLVPKLVEKSTNGAKKVKMSMRNKRIFMRKEISIIFVNYKYWGRKMQD